MSGSLAHQLPLELLRDSPGLVSTLLGELLGLALPAHRHVTLEDTDASQALPPEFRADLVVTLRQAGAPVLGVVVEVQRRRATSKRFAWPVYAAVHRARIRRDVLVLVLTDSDPVARWASQPIPLGGASRFVPFVLGPGHIPRLDSPERARRRPELAVLSSLAHGNGPDGIDVVLAALGAAEHLDAERAALYTDLIVAALDPTGREALEQAMQTGRYQPKSDLARAWFAEGEARGRAEGEVRGRAEGEARGRAEGEAHGRAEGEAHGRAEGEARGLAKAIFLALEARGIPVSRTARARILATQDLATLEQWSRRAVTCVRAADLFQ